MLIIFFKNLSKDNVKEKHEKVNILNSKEGVIITISRMHGTRRKYIGELVAKKLKISYYYKELTAVAAEESGLDKEFISKLNRKTNVLHDLYLTTSPVKYAIEAQEKVIKKIASKGSCVIIGRAADYVLRNNKNLVRIFIYAKENYRIQSVMEMYGDTETEAKKSINRFDKNRASYYNIISSKSFGDVDNYDLCIDSSIGIESTVNTICDFIKNRFKLEVKKMENEKCPCCPNHCDKNSLNCGKGKSYFSVGNTQETLVKNVEKHHAHHRHHDKKEKHYNNENKNAQF